jgi:hypothetical protein
MLKNPAKPRGQAFWPIMGFFLILSLGTLSYIATPAVVGFLTTHLPNFPPAGVKPDSWNLIVGGILFMLMIMSASVVVAATASKKKSAVDEKGIIKDRQEMLNYRKAAKLRQNELNRQQHKLNAGR